jgi:hypothetical protein
LIRCESKQKSPALCFTMNRRFEKPRADDDRPQTTLLGHMPDEIAGRFAAMTANPMRMAESRNRCPAAGRRP